MRLAGMAWTYEPDRIVGTGRFEVRVVDNERAAPRDVHGWMRIEAVPTEGIWKIRSLKHGTTE